MKVYQSITKACEYCYEEKRSRFMAFIYPVKSKAEGFAYYESLKQQYPDARHHCWAYLLGNPEQAQTAGFNDDGEPGGTAGKPMLNVLSQRKVGDVFAIVVRYFGGVKLGAGGLTRAYGQAVSQALDAAEFTIIEPRCKVKIEAEFSLENLIRVALKNYTDQNPEVSYSQHVTLECELNEASVPALKQDIQGLSSGKASCLKLRGA